MNQSDEAVVVQGIVTQLSKAKDEIIGRIQALIDAAQASDVVSPELQAAIDAAAGVAQQLDDIVPDAP